MNAFFDRLDATRAADIRPVRGRGALLVIAAATAVLLVAAIQGGAIALAPGEMATLVGSWFGLSDADSLGVKRYVFEQIRIPRVMLAAAAGAALAAAGAVMQGLFRNPLADPGLIGVSSGGALAAVAVIVLAPTVTTAASGWVAAWTLPMAAFAGALATTALTYWLSSRGGVVAVSTLLLGGVAINALAGAGIGYLTFLSDEQQLRLLTFWTLGSAGGASMAGSGPAIVAMLLSSVAAWRLADDLNVVFLGETAARHLGVDVARLKRRASVVCAVGVGAAVSACGTIGFVGLVVPHLVRLIGGPDHRTLLPGSAMLGAGLLALSDLIARSVVVPAELPLGVVTAMLGAPFFLWLLLRDRRRLGI